MKNKLFLKLLFAFFSIFFYSSAGALGYDYINQKQTLQNLLAIDILRQVQSFYSKSGGSDICTPLENHTYESDQVNVLMGLHNDQISSVEVWGNKNFIDIEFKDYQGNILSLGLSVQIKDGKCKNFQITTCYDCFGVK